MKNFLQVNQLFGTVGSPNQTDETQTRENRVGGIAYASPMHYLRNTLSRYAAMLLCVLMLGVGQMWGTAPATSADTPGVSGTVTFEDWTSITYFSNNYWKDGVKLWQYSNETRAAANNHFTTSVTHGYNENITAGSSWGSYTMSGLTAIAHFCLGISVKEPSVVEIIVNNNLKDAPALTYLKVLADNVSYATKYGSGNYTSGTDIKSRAWITCLTTGTGRYKISIPVFASDFSGDDPFIVKLSQAGFYTNDIWVFESITVTPYNIYNTDVTGSPTSPASATQLGTYYTSSSSLSGITIVSGDKWLKHSSSGGYYTLTFSPALNLSSYTAKKIDVWWATSGGNGTTRVYLNGSGSQTGSDLTLTSGTRGLGTIDIPDGTTSLSSIKVQSSGNAAPAWFRIGVRGTEVLCTAPTAVYVTQTAGTADLIAGESFTLSAATSTGVEDGATYQWYRGDTPVGTNSPTYTVSSCTSTDAGTYWCKITNPCSEDAHTTNSTGYGIKVWQVLLYGSSWNAYNLTSTGTKTGETTAQLAPGTYYIKLTHNNGVDFGVNTGGTISDINATTGSPWTLYNGQNNIRLNVSTAGSYTFDVDYTSADNPTLSVTYPPATISSCDKIYFCPTQNSIATGSAKFSIYFWNDTENGWANCYLVDGTEYADDAKYVAFAPSTTNGWKKMIVVRDDEYASSFSGIWNQSQDITYNGYDYIVGTGWSDEKFTNNVNSFYSSTTPAMDESEYCVVVGGTTTASTNLPSSAVTYTSANTSVAEVGSSTGVITGVAAGSTTITAKVGSCTVGSATVTVYAAPSVSLSSSSATYGGSAPTLTANNFATITGYSSSTTGTATINGSGVISIAAAGTTTFTVTGTDACGNVAEATTSTFTVNRANITPALSYSSTTLTYGGGNSSTPTITGNTGSGTVTYSVTASSPSGCITVNGSTGVVTPVAAGTGTVTATIGATTNYNGNTATADFTVNKATPTKYDFSVDKTVLCGDETATLTLEDSEDGVTYELRSDATHSIADTQKSGTGLAISWEDLGAGSYVVYAVENATYAERQMNGSKITVSTGTTTSITTGPTSVLDAVVGSATSLSVTAAGTSLTYQWKQCATEDGTYANVASGGTSATYNVTPAAAGTIYYKVVVTGTCGTVTSSAVSIVATAPVLYTVTFDANGGTIDDEDKAEATQGSVGGEITLLTPDARSGYTFDGWEDKDENLIGVAGASYTPTGNITLYAKWTALDGVCQTMNSAFETAYLSNHTQNGVTYDLEWFDLDDANGLYMGTNNSTEQYSHMDIGSLGMIKEVKLTITAVGASADNKGIYYQFSADHDNDVSAATAIDNLSTGDLSIRPASGEHNTFKIVSYNTSVKISNICIYYTDYPVYTVSYNAMGGTCSPTTENTTTVLGKVTLPSATNSTYDLVWVTSDGKEAGGAGDTYKTTSDVTLYAKWIGDCDSGGASVTFTSSNKNDAGENFATMSTATSNTSQMVGNGAAKLIAIGTDAELMNDVRKKKVGYRYDSQCDFVFKFDDTSTLDLYLTNNGKTDRACGLYSFSSEKALSAITASDYSSKTIVSTNVTAEGAEVASVGAPSTDPSISDGVVTPNASGGMKISYTSLAAGYYVFHSNSTNTMCLYSFEINGGGSPCYTVTYHGNGATSGYVNDPAQYAEDAIVYVSSSTGSYTRDGGYEFNGWNTKADGSGDKIAYFTITKDTTLYAQWRIVVNTNTTNLTAYDDPKHKDVRVTNGATLTLTQDTTVRNITVETGSTLNVNTTNGDGSGDGITLTANSLSLVGGWGTVGEETKYDMPRVYIDPKSTLTKTVNTVNFDIAVDERNYYPIALPFDVALNDVNYVNTTLSSYVSSHREACYGTYFAIKEYDGAKRAERGGNSENWKLVEEGTLTPGKGYILSAVTVPGLLDADPYAVIRFPMSFTKAWTTEGEQGTVSEVTKNVIEVTAYEKAEGETAKTNKGWNLLGIPYMSCYQTGADMYTGDGAAAIMQGKFDFKTNKFDDEDKIRYVSVPTHDFSEYLQYNIEDEATKLLPGWCFFVQVEKTGNLTYAVTNQKASSDLPIYAPQREQEHKPTVKTGIILSGAEASDKTTILVSDKYSATDYEINADLEKMFGNGYTLATYSLAGTTRLAYNAMSNSDATNVIPIGYRAPAGGEYTFAINPRYAESGAFEHVNLIDYETGFVTDLLVSSYSFATERTQNDERFALNVVKAPQTATDITVTGDGLQVTGPQKVIINDKLYIIVEGKMYDAKGVMVK